MYHIIWYKKEAVFKKRDLLSIESIEIFSLFGSNLFIFLYFFLFFFIFLFICFYFLWINDKRKREKPNNNKKQ